ncbi:MAG: YbbR-like domain-containing protein [Candidatus Omnitrophota bacterium]|nr:YbbR-like domain-containing protein [Candidatus Omnitrophota bacterium]
MRQFVRDFFTKHLVLKVLSLILSLLIWFYIVSELNKGSNEESQILRKMRPGENIVAKKLEIKPVLVGRPYSGYNIKRDQVVAAPEYCMVVGPKDALDKIKFAYTMPVDVKRASKSFTVPVPLSPIAPGVYIEEIPVQVTVPVEKEADRQIQL